MPWRIRRAAPTDHDRIVSVVDAWWGGRQMAGLVQPLFLEHFSSTSLVAETSDGDLCGFLIGFVSGDDPRIAYVHFAGVDPSVRGGGLGRALYDTFADDVARRGVRTVACVTSIVNDASVAFHRAIGFEITGHREAPHVDGGTYVCLARALAPSPSLPWGEVEWPPSEGARLVGRFVEIAPTTSADAADLFVALDDPRVWQHLTVQRPRSDGEMAGVVEAACSAMHPWTVRLATEVDGLPVGTVVGWSSYLEVSPRDARLEIGSTAYSPRVWGTVVNPETKLLLLGYAFDVLGFGRVQLKTDVRNTRSQDAIARLGASREGLLRRYQRRLDGSVRDTVLFSITDEEWPTVRDGLEGRLVDSTEGQPAAGLA